MANITDCELQVFQAPGIYKASNWEWAGSFASFLLYSPEQVTRLTLKVRIIVVGKPIIRYKH